MKRRLKMAEVADYGKRRRFRRRIFGLVKYEFSDEKDGEEER